MDDTISRQAVKYLDLFKKTYCRDESVKNDLVFRCNQCDFQLPDKTCLVKTMARKLCPDYKEFGSMGDLMGDSISRQAAINAVNDCGICIQKILDIPSVQTEQTTQTNTSNTLNALDCVSRQAAIDAICKHGTELERRGITVLSVANHKQATVDLLESLPSAQPDLKADRIEAGKMPEPRWIPIDGKARLPRDGQRVLITDEDGEIEVAYFIDFSNIDESVEWWSHDYQCHPIAWCEIPKPYERSEE